MIGSRWIARSALIATMVVALVGCATTANPGSTGAPTTATAQPGATVVATHQPPMTPTVAPGAGGNLGGFVGEFSDGVIFVAWTETQGALSGNFTQFRVALGATTGEQQSIAISGLRSGDDVTLSLLDRDQTWTGRLRPGGLTLSWPRQDGGFSVVELQDGSVVDYNAAVAGWQRRLASEAEQQAAQATLDKRVNDAADTLDRALRALKADLNTTQNYAERASSEATVGTDSLAMVRDALEEVKSEAAVTPMDDYRQGTVCYKVGTVDYQKGTVAYHTDEARNQGSLEADKAPTVAADIAAVRAAAAELEAAIAANPAGPASRTSPAAARGTADEAKSKLANANARTAEAVKEAAAADKTAASLLSQAQSIALSVGASCE